MLMVATFMYPPTRSNFTMKEVLRLPDVFAFGPISASRKVPKRILVSLSALYCLEHSASEVEITALASILVLMEQRESGGAIASVSFEFFESCICVPSMRLRGQNKDSY